MGLQLALTVALGTWGGHWAETRWGFAPWGIVGGTLLGAAVGLTVFLMEVSRMGREPSGSNGEKGPS